MAWPEHEAERQRDEGKEPELKRGGEPKVQQHDQTHPQRTESADSGEEEERGNKLDSQRRPGKPFEKDRKLQQISRPRAGVLVDLEGVPNRRSVLPHGTRFAQSSHEIDRSKLEQRTRCGERRHRTAGRLGISRSEQREIAVER